MSTVVNYDTSSVFVHEIGKKHNGCHDNAHNHVCCLAMVCRWQMAHVHAFQQKEEKGEDMNRRKMCT